MATLRLVQFDGGEYGLQATGDPSQNADFSLYDLDGEGGDPFAFGNQSWNVVPGIDPVEFNPDDSDDFWDAQQAILNQMRAVEIAD